MRPFQPSPGLPSVACERRQADPVRPHDAGHHTLQRRAAFRQGSAQEGAGVAGSQAVEQHQQRRRFRRELADAALCGMHPVLQRPERQAVAPRHHQLTVQDEVVRLGAH